MPEQKRYLGDSVYATYDRAGGGIILTTENGEPLDPSNIIYLEVVVLIALIDFSRANGINI